MRNILIDPVLFIVPENATPQEKVKYLNGLELLREAFLEMSDCEWHFSGSVAYLLHTKNLFPDFNTLRRFLNAVDAASLNVDVDIKQIHEWTKQFFISLFDDEIDLTTSNEQLQKRLEQFEYSAVDAQAEKTTFRPGQFFQRWDTSIQPAMKFLFAKLCVCAHLKHSFVADLLIATKAFTGEESATREVVVDTIMEYLSLKDEPVLPEIISHTFPLVIFPDNLNVLDNLNNPDNPGNAGSSGAEGWLWDQTEAGLRAAIDKEYEERYRDMLGENQSQPRKLPLRYTFGSHFIEDLKEISASTTYVPRKVVEAAAAVIADQVHGTAHFHAKALRKSKGGGIPGRHRGNDKAWRVYVTVRRGGWRLNYWQGPDIDGQERIEFSVIQKKEEKEKIYDD